MVNVKVGTATNRDSVVVSVDTPITEVLKQSSAKVGSSTLFLNGAPLLAQDYSSTLAALGVADESEATLLAVVKADSAQ